jgi:transposase
VRKKENRPVKKNSTGKSRQKPVTEVNENKLLAVMEAHREKQPVTAQLTIGIDLGDRGSCYCVLDEKGEVLERDEVVTDRPGLELVLRRFPPSVVALEVGTHSPWVSRVGTGLGHRVIVANARRVKLISESSRKNDRLDAELLARLARADEKLLAPVRHRSETAQADLTLVRVRAQLVELRTQTINAARGLVKSFGQRLPPRDAGRWKAEHADGLAPGIQPHIRRLLRVVQELSQEIDGCEQAMEKMAAERYAAETQQLQQVGGVGPVTSLSYVLTLEDPHRFARSRDVGPYLGLRPRSKQSSAHHPEMSISKEGDVYLRKLLVQGAQYILSQKGPDTDLKRWGLQIAAKGKKKAKRRAVVAVARKLAILLHHLWVSGERYEPRRTQRQPAAAA